MDPDDQKLNEKIARLEERMNTMQARYEGALDRLRADMAQRDRQHLLAVIAVIAIGLTIHGFLTA